MAAATVGALGSGPAAGPPAVGGGATAAAAAAAMAVAGPGPVPVPMNLFATWEIDRSAPSCVPR